jgi:6-phosphogluconolactonase
MFLSIVFSLFSFAHADSLTYQLVVGSYTQSGNPGIEVFDISLQSGQSKKAYDLQAPAASFQHISADGHYLFSVTEESGGKSAVSSFVKNAKGQFEKLSASLTTSPGPCFILYREASKTLYVANYSGGSLSVFKTSLGRILPISQLIQYTGSSINPSRQKESHAHMTVLSPDQNYLFVNDLGTDKIYQHKIFADGTVEEKYTSTSVPAGQGPRHLIFNKSGSHAYLITELKGQVDVFQVSNNSLNLVQTLDADTAKSPDKGSADIHLSPNEKWLISSNRISSNELTIFAVQADGLLKKVKHQTVARKPRNFNFDPTGKFVYVASQDDHKVEVYSFNDQTGELNNTHQDILVKAPVSLHFIEKEIDAEAQIKTLKIGLKAATPAIANYIKCVISGNMVYLSGHIPDPTEGVPTVGKLGKELSVEQGQVAARLVGINLLSTLKANIGDLNRVKRIVKVNGFVNSESTFTQQPAVMNGFSNLMVEIFGERGRHTRSAIGVNVLPNNVSVEIDMVVELK